jgi:hypothetical protein
MNDSGWTSFYKYFSEIGLLKHKGLNKYIDLLSSGIFLNVMFNGVCIISKMPTTVLRDNNNRLNSLTNHAVKFKDGYGQYYVHGVFFDDITFNKYFIDKKYVAKDILELRNAEQRTVIIQELGYDKIISDVDKKIIDKQSIKWNNTDKIIDYELIEFKIDNNTVRVIKVEWYERDKKRQTILGVPIQESTNNCIGAIAWTFNMTKEEYLLKEEA